MMVESGVGRVPIVDPQCRRVVGILSRQDLLKVRSAQQRGETVQRRRKLRADSEQDRH